MSRPAKTAVKHTPPSTPSSAPAAARAPALPLLWPLLLAGLALAEGALSLYQWVELRTLRAGGSTACSINETLNCETVWNSPFASRVHELTGMPVAALGVVWALAALVGAAALAWQVRRTGPLGSRVGGVRLVAAAGLLSCITFAVASARAGALCPTCLATYALVVGYAVVAFVKLPGAALPAGPDLGRALAWAAAPALLAYPALLGPGLSTPRADAQGLKTLARMGSAQPSSAAPAAAPSRPLTERERQVAAFVQGLAPMEQQALANALAAYRSAPAGATAGYAPRRLAGDAGAPLKMVEWTDILCPHCAELAVTVKELKRVVPPGLMSVEARQFPLASACNPMVGRNDGGEVRCLAAKAQICLEQAPGYWEAREKLFAAQRSLTPALVLDIASSAGMARPALEACVAAPETQDKLKQDIHYATAHKLTGTPLVLLNGRKAPPYGPLIYALALLGGDADSPAFHGLPPPKLGGDGHEGHGH